MLKPSVQKKEFGILPDGDIVYSCILNNGNGIEAEILTLGGILNRLFVPDKKGAVSDVVLGRERLEQYLGEGFCTSAIIGRFANRIAGGTYEWNGTKVILEQNYGKDLLHSGSGNYASKNFAESLFTGDNFAGVRLNLWDVGEGGFPGKAEVIVLYRLFADGRLELEYRLLPEKDTPINVTSHAYFNLAGQERENLQGHTLWLNADAYLPADSTGMPTGEIRKVEGTAFDFRKKASITEGMESEDEQMLLFHGYDHNFCLNGRGMRKAAVLSEESSVRFMEVYTDMPGMQLFTTNNLPQPVSGKDGSYYFSHCAVCLETQQYPNAVNEPDFPAAIFVGGKWYISSMVFKFGVQE